MAVGLAMSLASASAQDPAIDPFATPPVDRPAAVVVPPASVVDAAPEPPPPIDLSQYGPAVRAVVEREPATPADLLEGVLLLVELGEPELAGPWLDTLMQAPPDPPAQAELARRFGSHRLMQLASADALGEDARELATSMMRAYAAEVRAPERLNQLIAELAAENAEVRYAAVAGLIEAGDAAAAALVAALDDAQGERHRRWIQIALAELAPESIGPLLAGLQAESAAIRADSATVLGRVAPAHLAHRLLGPALVDETPQVRRAASEAVSRLVGSAPSPHAAEQILQESLDQLLERNRPLATHEAGEVEIWYWDSAGQAPAATKLAAESARVYLASRLARDLVGLVPANAEYRTRDTMLQLAAGELGLPSDEDTSAIEIAQRRRTTIAALDEALRRDLPRGVIGAARELAGMPDPDAVLMSHAPAESPLVRALAHPETAVRWEALSAIMRLDPQGPFPGASRVTAALAEYIQSGGRPRAVVALPTMEQARNLAAALDRLGYAVTLATSGRQAILAAGESGGADLVLVDARISRPPLREVLYQIRANPSSTGAAIGVLGTGTGLDRARETSADHPGIQAFPHPWELSGSEEVVVLDGSAVPAPPELGEEEAIEVSPRVVLDDEAVERILERLGASESASTPEGVPTRQEMAGQALVWLGELLARSDTFYDVRRLEPVVLQAVDHPNLAGTAVKLLAHFGSHESQLQLVNLATARIVPVELRQAAAEAFRASAGKYGLQLTTGEILRQYDRYNASERADRPTQLVLGHVLDTIEMKRMQTAAE